MENPKVRVAMLEKTAQEVFDYVGTHLMNQGRASLDYNEQCSYRGENGTSCAAGCLLTDDEYDLLNQVQAELPDEEGLGPTIEDHSWSALVKTSVADNHCELIGCLQSIHDGASLYSGSFRSRVRLGLSNLAEGKGLSMDNIPEVDSYELQAL